MTGCGASPCSITKQAYAPARAGGLEARENQMRRTLMTPCLVGLIVMTAAPARAANVHAAAPRTQSACNQAIRAWRTVVLAGDDEAPAQQTSIEDCTHKQWMAAVAPYTGRSMNSLVVTGGGNSATKVLKAICGKKNPAPACQGG